MALISVRFKYVFNDCYLFFTLIFTFLLHFSYLSDCVVFQFRINILGQHNNTYYWFWNRKFNNVSFFLFFCLFVYILRFWNKCIKHNWELLCQKTLNYVKIAPDVPKCDRQDIEKQTKKWKLQFKRKIMVKF